LAFINGPGFARTVGASAKPDRKCIQSLEVLSNDSEKILLFRHGRASPRPSTSFLFLALDCKDVDARHKAGHDEL
jgi:hypothetical protein